MWILGFIFLHLWKKVGIWIGLYWICILLILPIYKQIFFCLLCGFWCFVFCFVFVETGSWYVVLVVLELLRDPLASRPYWAREPSSATHLPQWCVTSAQTQKQWVYLNTDWNLWNFGPPKSFLFLNCLSPVFCPSDWKLVLMISRCLRPCWCWWWYCCLLCDKNLPRGDATYMSTHPR